MYLEKLKTDKESVVFVTKYHVLAAYRLNGIEIERNIKRYRTRIRRRKIRLNRKLIKCTGIVQQNECN